MINKIIVINTNDSPCNNCIVKVICRNKLLTRYKLLKLVIIHVYNETTLLYDAYMSTLKKECELIDDYVRSHIGHLNTSVVSIYEEKRKVIASVLISIFNIKEK